jgi:hypothetical protein
VIQQHGTTESSTESSGACLAIRTVNKMLASELAVLDDDHLSSSPDNFHFQCPAKSCGSVFDADVPYSTFVAHVGNHAAELFIPGGFRKCYFGCHEDFIDELQRRAHTKFCPPYHKLPHASKVPTPIYSCHVPNGCILLHNSQIQVHYYNAQ